MSIYCLPRKIILSVNKEMYDYAEQIIMLNFCSNAHASTQMTLLKHIANYKVINIRCIIKIKFLNVLKKLNHLGGICFR